MTDPKFEELLDDFAAGTRGDENAGLLGRSETTRARRLALLAYFEERTATVMERLDVIRDGLENGMQENEDGTYTVIWTKRQLETAKKEAKRLYDKLFAESDEVPR